MFAAVLDTCVLWPSLQRDFLLSLAITGLYRPLWSDRLLEELEFHEARKLVERGDADQQTAVARAGRLIGMMRSSFDDSLVEGWEPLEGTLGLPDPDDEHVLAAAIVGSAGAIVTNNDKDFPACRVPKHIQILKPAQFAADTVAVDPERALRAVEAMVTRRTKPPESVDQVLQNLIDRYSMDEAVDLMRSVL